MNAYLTSALKTSSDVDRAQNRAADVTTDTDLNRLHAEIRKQFHNLASANRRDLSGT